MHTMFINKTINGDILLNSLYCTEFSLKEKASNALFSKVCDLCFKVRKKATR